MTEINRTARIGHVLFLDIVASTRETVTVQARLLDRLNAVANASETFRDARERKAAQPIPTGDGMILLFQDDVTAPARCAVEIARALKSGIPVPLRMGIHSGLVQQQLDIAGNENIVGEGVNTAQRVMDFGDAGHILLSGQYAGWLRQFEEWEPQIFPLGEAVAKYDLRLSIFTLHGEDFGNEATPNRLPVAPTKAKTTPAVSPLPSGCKIALLSKRDAEPDGKLLDFIENRLRAEGHEVFVDRGRKLGVAWAQETEDRIREADAVIAIVSPRSLQSEMLEWELETAQEQYHKTGKPVILPVRLGMDPSGVQGPINAVISPLNQFQWYAKEDDHRLLTELLSAIREPPKPRGAEIRLEPVGGAVPPDSPFYIERACDGEMRVALAAAESLLLFNGARQMGKTSLQARGAQQARELGWRVGITDFQKLNTAQMASEDVFYRLLAATLARQMKFQYDFAAEWDELFGANLNMDNFLRELLDSADEPLVWCMDEVDKLFTAPFASDFFGLVRSWHNARSTEPGGPWYKLTIIIAYATEAHLFIQDLNQSPFNVGRRLDLENFNLQQMVELNGRYGGPLKSYSEADELHGLIGGQPFLSRRALDGLATGKWDFRALIEQAHRDDGPFSDHLKRILVSVSRLPEVMHFVKAVLRGDAAPNSDQSSYYRLLAAGVITQRKDGDVDFRCELYRRYLLDHITPG